MIHLALFRHYLFTFGTMTGSNTIFFSISCLKVQPYQIVHAPLTPVIVRRGRITQTERNEVALFTDTSDPKNR